MSGKKCCHVCPFNTDFTSAAVNKPAIINPPPRFTIDCIGIRFTEKLEFLNWWKLVKLWSRFGQCTLTRCMRSLWRQILSDQQLFASLTLKICVGHSPDCWFLWGSNSWAWHIDRKRFITGQGEIVNSSAQLLGFFSVYGNFSCLWPWTSSTTLAWKLDVCFPLDIWSCISGFIPACSKATKIVRIPIMHFAPFLTHNFFPLVGIGSFWNSVEVSYLDAS